MTAGDALSRSDSEHAPGGALSHRLFLILRRLAGGYYDRADVRRAVAERVIESSILSTTSFDRDNRDH